MFRENLGYNSTKGAESGKSVESAENDNLSGLEEEFSEALDSADRAPESKWQRVINAGQNLVKNISAEVARACKSNHISVHFREIYLLKNANSLYKNLSTGEKPVKSETVKDLFRTVKGGFWGNGRNGMQLEYDLERLLEQISGSLDPILSDAEISALFP